MRTQRTFSVREGAFWATTSSSFEGEFFQSWYVRSATVKGARRVRCQRLYQPVIRGFSFHWSTALSGKFNRFTVISQQASGFVMDL